MILKISLITILLIGFSTALEVDFDCPTEVSINEEFSCDLELINREGTYDLKVEIKKGSKTITQIWDPEKEDWKSGYYYLNSFIKDFEEVQLKITELGEHSGILKLRKDSKTETFPFEIITLENKETKTATESEEEEKVVKKTIKKEVLPIEGEVIKQTIELNNEGLEEVEEIEKDFKKEILLKGIGIFFLILIGFFVWEKL